MNNLIINPDILSNQLIIDKDDQIRYFLSNFKSTNKEEINIIVNENCHVELIMVDFSVSNIDLDLNVTLNRNSSFIISLASIGFKDTQKVFKINANHKEGDSYSRINMNGINTSNGILKFLGSSYIANGSHRSDTRQEGRITNLSLNAKSEVSPSLLIKDNDVNASHGAALGAYNPDHIFYLMSRGLSLQESKKLITFGSLLPVIEKLDDENIVNQAKETLENISL